MKKELLLPLVDLPRNEIKDIENHIAFLNKIGFTALKPKNETIVFGSVETGVPNNGPVLGKIHDGILTEIQIFDFGQPSDGPAVYFQKLFKLNIVALNKLTSTLVGFQKELKAMSGTFDYDFYKRNAEEWLTTNQVMGGLFEHGPITNIRKKIATEIKRHLGFLYSIFEIVDGSVRLKLETWPRQKDEGYALSNFLIAYQACPTPLLGYKPPNSRKGKTGVSQKQKRSIERRARAYQKAARELKRLDDEAEIPRLASSFRDPRLATKALQYYWSNKAKFSPKNFAETQARKEILNPSK